jgi:ribonuclease P protein component
MSPRSVGRITTRAAFADLQRSKARASSGPVRAVFVPARDQEQGVFPQVGYAIGRDCGGAVVRKTLRRRVRAVAHLCAPELQRGKYLVRLDAEAASVPAPALRTHVAEALRRAGGTTVTP